MNLLERLVAYAAEHGHCARINWGNHDISVLVSYGHGAQWHHASNFRQLRAILGY